MGRPHSCTSSCRYAQCRYPHHLYHESLLEWSYWTITLCSLREYHHPITTTPAWLHGMFFYRVFMPLLFSAGNVHKKDQSEEENRTPSSHCSTVRLALWNLHDKEKISLTIYFLLLLLKVKTHLHYCRLTHWWKCRFHYPHPPSPYTVIACEKSLYHISLRTLRRVSRAFCASLALEDLLLKANIPLSKYIHLWFGDFL